MGLQKKLNTYTKLSPTQRSRSIKWIAKQNEELILIAFEKQKDYFFKISAKDEPNKSMLYLSALYLAIDEIYNTLKSQDSKNRVLNINEVKDTTKMQAKQFKQSKNSEKYDKLLNLKEKIFKLIDKENLSFRDVSAFLKKYHKFEVSHSYVATFYHKTKEK